MDAQMSGIRTVAVEVLTPLGRYVTPVGAGTSSGTAHRAPRTASFLDGQVELPEGEESAVIDALRRSPPVSSSSRRRT